MVWEGVVDQCVWCVGGCGGLVCVGGCGGSVCVVWEGVVDQCVWCIVVIV